MATEDKGIEDLGSWLPPPPGLGVEWQADCWRPLHPVLSGGLSWAPWLLCLLTAGSDFSLMERRKESTFMWLGGGGPLRYPCSFTAKQAEGLVSGSGRALLQQRAGNQTYK